MRDYTLGMAADTSQPASPTAIQQFKDWSETASGAVSNWWDTIQNIRNRRPTSTSILPENNAAKTLMLVGGAVLVGALVLKLMKKR